ncbi:MAG: 1,4-alpha-glucan branching protein domain-containing protein, partial [Pyrinomonadaceae bacterium]
GEPRPRYGVHAPVRVESGVAAFARDLESSEQVWSANVGYPGDPAYREFYRDLGWDAPLEYLRPHLSPDARRRDLGLKYHRVTGRDVPLDAKLPYDPEAAAARVRAHAQHFVGERIRQARELSGVMGARAPLVVAPYDAELFGHWWHEGVEFLECVLRLLHERRAEIACVTPGDYLDAAAANALPLQTQRLSASSWGEEGYFKVWLSDANAWLYPRQHAAEARMTALADRFSTNEVNDDATVGAGATDDSASSALNSRALRQCARELLLAQSSDWAFQIYRGATAEYAARRFRRHVARFDALAGQLESGALDERRLAAVEREDNLFAELDPRAFRTRPEAGA